MLLMINLVNFVLLSYGVYSSTFADLQKEFVPPKLQLRGDTDEEDSEEEIESEIDTESSEMPSESEYEYEVEGEGTTTPTPSSTSLDEWMAAIRDTTHKWNASLNKILKMIRKVHTVVDAIATCYNASLTAIETFSDGLKDIFDVFVVSSILWQENLELVDKYFKKTSLRFIVPGYRTKMLYADNKKKENANKIDNVISFVRYFTWT